MRVNESFDRLIACARSLTHDDVGYGERPPFFSKDRYHEMCRLTKTLID